MATVACALAWISMASAQQPVRPIAPAPTGQPGLQVQGNPSSDHTLEQWLIIDNEGEIELAKFAQNKSQNEEVQGFARMMIQDHTDFVNNLRTFHQKHAPAQGGPFGSRPTGAQAAAQPRPAGFDVVGLKRQLSKQCLATFKEEFGNLEGRQFDTCYMGHQMAAHLHMLDTLKVFKQHASPELADLIAQGIETTEDHLMHARKMMKELDGTAETAQRPANTERK